MDVLPSVKRFRRRTRLENAAKIIESQQVKINELAGALERSLVLQVKMYKALKQFANGSNWAESLGNVLWVSDDSPQKLAQKVLDELKGPEPEPKAEEPFVAATDEPGDAVIEMRQIGDPSND